MSKQHYERIAAIIAHERDNNIVARDGELAMGGVEAAERIAERLAVYFSQDNPRFDRVRFLKACGVEREREAA